MHLSCFTLENISYIGVDMAGTKRPADYGIFIIENLNHLDLLLKETKVNPFTAYTFHSRAGSRKGQQRVRTISLVLTLYQHDINLLCI